MSFTSEIKGHAGPAQDDDAFSGSSYVSDEHTLPGDSADDDARSVSSASSFESYDSFCPRERLPSYRVPRSQGTSQPVYEAWVLCMSHETDHEVTKLTSCGLDILSSHDEERPFVVSRTETHGQQELREMTLASVSSYHAANKRGFAARLFRGKPRSYEQDLDERLRRLPMSLQSELNGLLRNREEATSNRFRRRDWTVVMMREQYRYRFANATPEPVKKKRFGKGRDARRVEYLFVIKGAEGRVATDDRGMFQPSEFGNPWRRVDEEERRLRERSKDMARHGKGSVWDEWSSSPRTSPCPLPGRHGAVPPPYVQDNARRTRPVIIERERGRQNSSRSRSRSRSRTRSPYIPRGPSWSPVRNERLPHFNPFVPLPVPMGGMPPLPPTPRPYFAPTPGGRFIPPSYVPSGHDLPPFGLPAFEPYMRSQLHGPPAPGSNLAPETCTWQPLGVHHTYAGPEPFLQPDQFPISVPVQQQQQQQHAAPFPLEISSPPDSPRAYFHCMGGAPPMMPQGLPTMDACHRLFDAEFPHDDEDDDVEGDDDDTSSLRSSDLTPPPAPRPSNLTTPTEFSPAASQRTGSTVQSTDGTTAPGVPGMEVFWEGGPCPANRVSPSG